MNKTDAILSKGNTLFEDNQYRMIWTKFLGLSVLALTSYYVYVKKTKKLFKLNSKEKAYLMSVSYYLTKEFGLSPQAVINQTTLFRDFSAAIADRGSENWRSFLSENTMEKARYFAQQTGHKVKKVKH